MSDLRFRLGPATDPSELQGADAGAAELRRRAQGERRLGARGPLFDLAGNPPCCVNMLLAEVETLHQTAILAPAPT